MRDIYYGKDFNSLKDTLTEKTTLICIIMSINNIFSGPSSLLLSSQRVKNVSDYIHHVGPQLALICRGGKKHSCVIIYHGAISVPVIECMGGFLKHSRPNIFCLPVNNLALV